MLFRLSAALLFLVFFALPSVSEDYNWVSRDRSCLVTFPVKPYTVDRPEMYISLFADYGHFHYGLAIDEYPDAAAAKACLEKNFYGMVLPHGNKWITFQGRRTLLMNLSCHGDDDPDYGLVRHLVFVQKNRRFRLIFHGPVHSEDEGSRFFNTFQFLRK